jgi:presenilin-like A22 family membrane protease
MKYKNNKIPENIIKKNNIKINLAILGGGDIVFPIVAAGVFLKTFGNVWASLAVTLFASLALLYLFMFAEKKKFYPAMPYLTAGILLGMTIGWLLFIN